MNEEKGASEREKERMKKIKRRVVRRFLHPTVKRRWFVARVQNEVTSSRPIKYRRSGFN